MVGRLTYSFKAQCDIRAAMPTSCELQFMLVVADDAGRCSRGFLIKWSISGLNKEAPVNSSSNPASAFCHVGPQTCDCVDLNPTRPNVASGSDGPSDQRPPDNFFHQGSLS
ncbi:hypothetical protein AMECASPLE_039218 [Ameca splendens]|uniref:CUB domain-containing protein n=1 Tax=Ameca splendens TaxID=208324 RepID=A0ABV0ZIF2_9TELE